MMAQMTAIFILVSQLRIVAVETILFNMIGMEQDQYDFSGPLHLYQFNISVNFLNFLSIVKASRCMCRRHLGTR